MKLEFKDFPRWLNPELSHKEIKQHYEAEVRRIDEKAMRRKNPYYWYCVSFTDYTKLQWPHWQSNNQNNS